MGITDGPVTTGHTGAPVTPDIVGIVTQLLSTLFLQKNCYLLAQQDKTFIYLVTICPQFFQGFKSLKLKRIKIKYRLKRKICIFMHIHIRKHDF